MTVFAMANFFIAYALYILGIIVAAISPVVYKYTTDENWRYIIDETILGLPIIGKPLSVYYEIQFLRIISLAKKAKLPDIEAFELARESQTNLLYKNMLENIQKALRRSEDLSTVFAQNPYLSEDVSQIYKLAVKSNSIADMFLQLAESKEEHIGYMLTNAEKYADIANKFIISGLAIAMAYMFYFPLLQVSTIATQGASKM